MYIHKYMMSLWHMRLAHDPSFLLLHKEIITSTTPIIIFNRKINQTYRGRMGPNKNNIMFDSSTYTEEKKM